MRYESVFPNWKKHTSTSYGAMNFRTCPQMRRGWIINANSLREETSLVALKWWNQSASVDRLCDNATLLAALLNAIWACDKMKRREEKCQFVPQNRILPFVSFETLVENTIFVPVFREKTKGNVNFLVGNFSPESCTFEQQTMHNAIGKWYLHALFYDSVLT